MPQSRVFRALLGLSIVITMYSHTVQASPPTAARLDAAGVAPASETPYLTVNVLDDTDDGACTQQHCSLREAINAANALPGPNRIDFNILDATETVIRVQSPLPAVTESVELDAYAQPGWSGAPVVVLDGAAAGATAGGLVMRATSCLVRGLVIRNFDGNGILLDGGGTIHIEGCYVGTSADGMSAAGNSQDGIRISNSSGNTIGGERGNLISGNEGDGIRIVGLSSTGNMIRGNIIGMDAALGKALPNLVDGISLRNGARENDIGMPRENGPDNIIAGNGTLSLSIGGRGIYLSNVESNRIRGNLVGGLPGSALFGNARAGVLLENASFNELGGSDPAQGNRFIGNGGDGITVLSGQSNLIRGNLFAFNGRLEGDLPIDLGGDGRTPNDPGDTDIGPNNLRNFPNLSAPPRLDAEFSALGGISDVLVVRGTIDTPVAGGYLVDFYRGASAGDADAWIGSQLIQAGAPGIQPFEFRAADQARVGDYVLATVTGPGNDTSEMSAHEIVAGEIAGLSRPLSLFTGALRWGASDGQKAGGNEPDADPGFDKEDLFRLRQLWDRLPPSFPHRP